MVQPWLRFHTPLIEPDRQISRIRLSDKTSRLAFPRIVEGAKHLKPRSLYLDGEGVVCGKNGIAVFENAGSDTERNRAAAPSGLLRLDRSAGDD